MSTRNLIIAILMLLIASAFAAYSGAIPKSILEDLRKPAVTIESAGKAIDPENEGRPSFEVLRENRQAGPDGKPNQFFYTEEQARRLGIKKYASGPCKGYYEGEEWWCR